MKDKIKGMVKSPLFAPIAVCVVLFIVFLIFYMSYTFGGSKNSTDAYPSDVSLMPISWYREAGIHAVFYAAADITDIADEDELLSDEDASESESNLSGSTSSQTESGSSDSSDGSAGSSSGSGGSSASENQSGSSSSQYASFDEVMSNVLWDSRFSSTSDINLLSFDLDTSQDPPVYIVVFENKSGYTKYIYHVNAVNGLIRYRTYYNADNREDEENIFRYVEGDSGEDEDAVRRVWDEDCYSASGSDQSFYDGIPIIPFE